MDFETERTVKLKSASVAILESEPVFVEGAYAKIRDDGTLVRCDPRDPDRMIRFPDGNPVPPVMTYTVGGPGITGA